jgi:FKBP-type peptidyl-prolyl cis-trans isomerase FkpA
MTLSAPRCARTLISTTAAALAVLLAGAMPAHAQQGTAAPATATPGPAAPAAANPRSDDSYSLGVVMGAQLHDSGVTPQEVSSERLVAGLRAGLAGKVAATPADKEKVNALLRRAHEQAGESNHRAAAAFLANNGKKPDVVTTASGLQYKVLAPGSGDSPKATDTVVVNYRGSLMNGTEFDSSYKGGEPATFPVNRVIPGWTEALQLMKPGAKYQLFVPPQLAYDLRSPPQIPPGSLLVFDVELLSIKPPQAVAPPPAPAPGLNK